MYSTKNISILAVIMLTSSSFTLCMAQTTPAEASDSMVLVKPRSSNYNSGNPADAAIDKFMNRLTGKTKKQELQKYAWDDRVKDIKQILSEFSISQTSNGYYPGWQGDYTNCVYTQIDKLGPRNINWNLGSGEYGLSPDEANTLPPTHVVSECLTNVKAKYEKKENERANEQMQRDKAASCEASPDGQLAQLSAEIVHARNVVELAQTNLDQDKKVEAVSGVVDLETRHKMGEIVVYGQQAIRNDFLKYRQLGGKATSSADVVRLNDPCKALRQ